MKYADKYKHFKGGEYEFLGIALPMGYNDLSVETVKGLAYKGTVKHHDNKGDFELYFLDGAMFIGDDVPHVIYKSENHIAWAREVDDFFGCKETKHGNWIKRFTKIKE